MIYSYTCLPNIPKLPARIVEVNLVQNCTDYLCLVDQLKRPVREGNKLTTKTPIENTEQR